MKVSLEKCEEIIRKRLINPEDNDTVNEVLDIIKKNKLTTETALAIGKIQLQDRLGFGLFSDLKAEEIGPILPNIPEDVLAKTKKKSNWLVIPKLPRTRVRKVDWKANSAGDIFHRFYLDAPHTKEEGKEVAKSGATKLDMEAFERHFNDYLSGKYNSVGWFLVEKEKDTFQIAERDTEDIKYSEKQK